MAITSLVGLCLESPWPYLSGSNLEKSFELQPQQKNLRLEVFTFKFYEKINLPIVLGKPRIHFSQVWRQLQATFTCQ